jgi:hypothetical protein
MIDSALQRMYSFKLARFWWTLVPDGTWIVWLFSVYFMDGMFRGYMLGPSKCACVYSGLLAPKDRDEQMMICDARLHAERRRCPVGRRAQTRWRADSLLPDTLADFLNLFHSAPFYFHCIFTTFQYG